MACCFWSLEPGLLGATNDRAATGPKGEVPSASPVPMTAQDWMLRAHDAQSRGLMKPALEHIERAIQLTPQDPKPYYYRAQVYERLRRPNMAEIDMTRVIDLGATNDPGVFMQRGLLRFRLGEFGGCLADFDRYLQARPSKAAELWQRGIAFYYAGRPADGVRQFELHRTVNPNDVENSAWHFLCVAQTSGAEAAKEQWMWVKGDSRIPMAQIQDLMTGKGTAEAVLDAAKAVENRDRRALATFYANLYLALYYGATGRKDLEARYTAAAADEPEPFGMMGDVARLHAAWIAGGKPQPPTSDRLP
ncbi:MAG: hypothetical protein JNK85_29130 [Verrucomicrobiales bacterium]|nr:hypothetical protein [Verrucomicrobiales bacterium]